MSLLITKVQKCIQKCIEDNELKRVPFDKSQVETMLEALGIYRRPTNKKRKTYVKDFVQIIRH